MNIETVYNQIMGNFAGSAFVRNGKKNFLAVPTGDSNHPYIKVSVANLLANDTKNHEKFDFDGAVAEYTAWKQAEEAAKANKPKREYTPKVDPEAQARRDAQDSALVNALANLNGEYTASELKEIVPEFANLTVMQVGTCAHRIVDMGLMVVRKDSATKKNHYSRA